MTRTPDTCHFLWLATLALTVMVWPLVLVAAVSKWGRAVW